MHDLMDYFVDSKKIYYNLNNSIINKKVCFFIFKNYIIHFYNKLGSIIYKLLNIIPHQT